MRRGDPDQQLLARADRLHGPWHAGELRSLLPGQSIELARTDVPLAERDLLGLIEDPRLERLFARAHEALYTAPTDLTLAAALVREHQEALL